MAFFSGLRPLAASAKVTGTAQRSSLRVSRPKGRGKVQLPWPLSVLWCPLGRICGCVPLTLRTPLGSLMHEGTWLSAEGAAQNPNFFMNRFIKP